MSSNGECFWSVESFICGGLWSTLPINKMKDENTLASSQEIPQVLGGHYNACLCFFILLNFITSRTLYISHGRVVMIAWLMSPHLSGVWATTWSLKAVSFHLLSSPGYRRYSLSSFLLLSGPMNSTDLCNSSCVSPKKKCMCNTSIPWSVPCIQSATILLQTINDTIV